MAESILVLDDFSVMAKAIKGLLTQLGFSDVDACSDAVSAAEMLVRSQHSLLICAVEMSALDGIEFVRELRNSADTRNCIF